MADLSEEEAERAQNLLDRRQTLAQRREELHEAGDVERDLASFLAGLGGNYESIGILECYQGDLVAAQDAFERTADYYLRSAAENKIPQQGSLEYAKAMYVAALAGSGDKLTSAAKGVRALHEEISLEVDDHNADRFYFSGCLAGAILDSVTESELEALEAENDEKPDPDGLYGRAILSFARGVRDSDTAAIESGIESMLEYHDQQRHEDNVVDRIMAPQATALYILARYLDYDVQVDSEFVPESLVATCLSNQT